VGYRDSTLSKISPLDKGLPEHPPPVANADEENLYKNSMDERSNIKSALDAEDFYNGYNESSKPPSRPNAYEGYRGVAVGRSLNGSLNGRGS